MKYKGISLQSKKSIYGYLFVMPFVLGFIVFFISPFLFLVAMSFSDIGLTNTGIELKYIGVENFKNLFLQNIEYIKSVFLSVGELMARLPSIVFFSLFIAIILNQKFKGRFIVRAIFFLPVIISSGINAVSGNSTGLMSNAKAMIQGMYSNAEGGEATINITESIIKLFGGESGAGAKLIEVVAGIVSNIFTITQASGVQILIFIAALQTISPSLYEASRIDGATGWENFWKITLPIISPMILVNTVYTIVDSMAGADNSVITLIYNTAIYKIQYANSAAMSMVYFLVIYSMIGLVMFLLSKVIYYEEK